MTARAILSKRGPNSTPSRRSENEPLEKSGLRFGGNVKQGTLVKERGLRFARDDREWTSSGGAKTGDRLSFGQPMLLTTAMDGEEGRKLKKTARTIPRRVGERGGNHRSQRLRNARTGREIKKTQLDQSASSGREKAGA